MLKKLLLCLLSALLFSLPWLGAGGLSLFFAFVPLLILGRDRPRRYWLWAGLAFTIWIVATTWWVGISTAAAIAIVPMVYLVFTLLPFMIFHWFRGRAPKPISWGVFVTVWIAFEALFMNNEISFPWLTLGNGFAQMPLIVQWYELTGTYGGSLWVLVANVLVYEAWCGWQTSKARRWRVATPAILWIVLPMVASLVRYGTYEEEVNPVRVAVVQPNIDAYNEKFGGLTATEQRDIILGLAADSPRDVDFILTPETSFDGNFWLNELNENREVLYLRKFMTRFPQATMIAGGTTWLRYEGGMEQQRWTRHHPSGTTYDVYNSALGITANRQEVDVYHKSILVVGVEQFPYPDVLGFLLFMSVDLGGVSGSVGKQPERTLITSPEGIRAGVAICYESIYGEYYTEYVQRGAQVMFVITNDGWWGNTSGHHNHFNYARLRAIETRRAIARSANTGISGLINQRGDVLDSAGWDQKALLTGEINANNEMTFYVRAGDFVVRISLLVLALCVLYYVAWRFRRRSLMD